LPRDYPNIVAHAIDAAKLQIRAPRQVFKSRAPFGHATRGISDHDRGQVDQPLVDQAGLQQRTVEARTRLDMQLADFAGGQFRQQRLEVDPSMTISSVSLRLQPLRP
jgi:hypothetical protein